MDQFLGVGGGHLLAVLIGFCAYFFFQSGSKKREFETGDIRSNAGSTMFYLVSIAAIFVVLKTLQFLVDISIVRFFSLTPEIVRSLIHAAISLVMGAAYACFSLLRARDAGRPREFALLALLPLANLILVLATPKVCAARRPYVPKNEFLRISVGTLAVLATAYVGYFYKTVGQKIYDAQVNELIVERIYERIGKLPVQVDENTQFSSVDADAQTKEIAYYYTLSGADFTPELVSEFVTSEVKPSLVPQSCSDPITSEMGWVIHYRYNDEKGALLGEFSISKDDC